MTGLGRYDEAEPLLIWGFDFLLLKQPVEADNSYSRIALERLITFYEAVGQPDQVERYRSLIR